MRVKILVYAIRGMFLQKRIKLDKNEIVYLTFKLLMKTLSLLGRRIPL